MQNPPCYSLEILAAALSAWVEGEHAAYCKDWATYWEGKGEKPGKGPAIGQPLKDSDAHVYSEALACVKFGWKGRAHAHLERVKRRMKTTPLLTKFPLAARVGVPQVWDGKQ
jgi:hypothetical protein